jgi:hypothetical protein
MNDTSAPVSSEQHPAGPGVSTGPQTAPDGRTVRLPGAAEVAAVPLDDERLAAIEARATAATPGPWATCDDGTGLIDIAASLEDTGHGYRCRRYIGQVEADQIDNDPTHRDWTEEQDRQQVAADAAFIAHAREDINALLAGVRCLRDELAETKALHNPRLRGLLVKAATDRDQYVGWSTVADGPKGVWSRETAIEYGWPRTWLDRADATGTSARDGEGGWDDGGFVADQRGWLRRELLGDYAIEYLLGDRVAAYALLEPIEDEAPRP